MPLSSVNLHLPLCSVIAACTCWALLTDSPCLNFSSEKVTCVAAYGGVYAVSWSRLDCVYAMLEVELMPDGEKTWILGQCQRPVCRWALRTGDGINLLVSAHIPSGPRTAGPMLSLTLASLMSSLNSIFSNTSTSSPRAFTQELSASITESQSSF